MPIPHADRAIVAAEKVRDYLLNLEHPDGGPKAAWFHALGYSRDQWQTLAADLMATAVECDEFVTEATRFGVNTSCVASCVPPAIAEACKRYGLSKVTHHRDS